MTRAWAHRCDIYPILALLLLAGCGQGDADRQAEGGYAARVADVAQTAPESPPADLAANEEQVVPPDSGDDGGDANQTGGETPLAVELDHRIDGPDGFQQRLPRSELNDYELYKTVARDLYGKGALELNSHLIKGFSAEDGRVIQAPEFDVAQCGSLNILDQEKIDHRQAALQQKAARFVQLEQDLARAGYQRDLYAPALLRLERRMLQVLADDLADPQREDDRSLDVEGAFAQEVEPLRKARQPDRLPIVMDGGCGDGETEFPFEIRPADGVARIIRVFSFDVCDRRRLDPWNPDKCRNWVSVRDGGSLPVSGSYRVQISWPDGRSYRGDFTTQAFTDEADVKPIRFAAPAMRGGGGGQ